MITQAVYIGCSSSTVTTCLTGVPQGSVLGPLLFSVTVCPLYRIPGKCGVQHHSYADDLFTYCTCALPSLQGASNKDDISQATSSIGRWYIENGMLLNSFKSAVITFCGKKSFDHPHSITIADTNLTYSKSLTALGVTV